MDYEIIKDKNNEKYKIDKKIEKAERMSDFSLKSLEGQIFEMPFVCH